ncbi:MAG: hypothetical protein JXO22_15795, partial [Phycisphaerae bacterium]|nr:hypothetical protein [Phycisphaerae bacterium]
MKSSIIVGILIAIVILGAWVFSPALRSAESKAGREAAEKAELARRELENYSPTLVSAAPHVDLEALREADFAALSEVVARTTDGEQTPSAGQLQGGVRAFDELLNANKQLLADAIRTADEAARTQGRPPAAAVNLIQGTARMLDAEANFAEAQRFRTELD